MNKDNAGLLPRGENTRGWLFRVNGDPIDTPNSLVILLEREPGKPETRLGRLEYGAEPNADGTPGKYDTFVFHELGGAVTLPFALIDDELYVGVVEQRRFTERHSVYNPAGTVQNAPRGFHNVGASALQTAEKELEEEVGTFRGSTFRLPGAPINANNAWFSYEDERGEKGESVGQGGVIPHAIEVNPQIIDIELLGGGYRINPGHLGQRPKGSPYELIGNCIFYKWEEAIQLRDGFTAIAVARLLAHLASQGKLTFG